MSNQTYYGMWKNVKRMMANETEAIQMQISSGINQL